MQRLLWLTLVLVLTAPLSGCHSPPPAQDNLLTRTPALFANDGDSYIVVMKPNDHGAMVLQQITMNGEGPHVFGTRAAIVWKVAPGIHTVTYDVWTGGNTVNVEVFEGYRAVLAIDNGVLSMRSFVTDQSWLATNVHLAGYYDISNRPPPQALRRRN